jgi:hypothetical protein
MVTFAKMDKFMGYNVIHQPYRQLEETPIEVKASIFSARTPTEAEVVDGYP